jgi:hypothetical protein
MDRWKGHRKVRILLNAVTTRLAKALEKLKFHSKFAKRCHNQANKGLGRLRKGWRERLASGKRQGKLVGI